LSRLFFCVRELTEKSSHYRARSTAFSRGSRLETALSDLTEKRVFIASAKKAGNARSIPILIAKIDFS